MNYSHSDITDEDFFSQYDKVRSGDIIYFINRRVVNESMIQNLKFYNHQLIMFSDFVMNRLTHEAIKARFPDRVKTKEMFKELSSGVGFVFEVN